MTAVEKFHKRMNNAGGTLRLERVRDSRRMLQSTFADDPSYIAEGVRIWHTDRIIHPRINEYVWKSTLPFQADIQTMYDEPIYMGDCLQWKNNGWWMVTGCMNKHDIHWWGQLQFCDWWLTFYSPLDGSLLEYPVALYNATQYGIGEERKAHLTVGSSQHQCFITDDEHTRMIDSGFRFMVDKNMKMPSVYKVTQVDTSTHNTLAGGGFFRLTFVEDQFNPVTDDNVRGIADAFEDPLNNGEEMHDTGKWI